MSVSSIPWSLLSMGVRMIVFDMVRRDKAKPSELWYGAERVCYDDSVYEFKWDSFSGTFSSISYIGVDVAREPSLVEVNQSELLSLLEDGLSGTREQR